MCYAFRAARPGGEAAPWPGTLSQKRPMHFDLETIRHALHPDFGMGWNAVLALVPLTLALWLFRPGHARDLWWPGLLAFLLFLPNSAYTLTDVIHLVYRIRREPLVPVWTVALVLIPQYAAFMMAGWQAHVLSLLHCGDYLRSLGRGRWVVPVETSSQPAGRRRHLFRAISGRSTAGTSSASPRSWRSTTIEDFTRRNPLEVVAVTFGVLIVLYYASKIVDRALIEYGQQRW